MLETLKFLVSASGAQQLVQISGHINDNADFQAVQLKPNLKVEIDLNGVKGINSSGLRELRAWTQKMENPVLHFSYCPKVFIDQINMIHGLIPDRAKITSFYVPYYSETSAEEKAVLFTVGLEVKVLNGKYEISYPAVTDSDGQEMTADIVVEKYFEFLRKFA